MRVRFSPRAISEVAAIGVYIASDNPSAAEHVVTQIEATALILGE
jgi:plasmid stabilization system protein ParE